jgi:hypothetical protein
MWYRDPYLLRAECRDRRLNRATAAPYSGQMDVVGGRRDAASGFGICRQRERLPDQGAGVSDVWNGPQRLRWRVWCLPPGRVKAGRQGCRLKARLGIGLFEALR